MLKVMKFRNTYTHIDSITVFDQVPFHKETWLAVTAGYLTPPQALPPPRNF